MVVSKASQCVAGKLVNLRPPVWVYGLLLYLSSLARTGYRVYFSNQALQLPLVALLNDPSLYPNDPFAATLPYYASLLWRLVALLVRVVPLETLLLALFLIERALSIAAAGYIGHVFAQESRLAMIGAMSFFALAPTPILGGGTLVTSYFEQTGLCIPFLLLAVASFHRARPIPWAVCLSIGFNLNAMYGTYAMTYFAAAFLLCPSYRARWKTWATATALFGMLASPAIILTASAFGRSAPDNELWLAAARARLPHHLYPLTWNKWRFVNYGTVLLLTVGLLHQDRGKTERLSRQGIIWAGVSATWLLYAFLAAYVAESPPLLVMQPARGTDLWYCFAGIALISIGAQRLEEHKEDKVFVTGAFFASVFFWRLPSIPSSLVLLALMALAWRPVWERVFDRGRPDRAALILVVSILLLGGWSLRARLRTGRPAFVVRPDSQLREIADWAKMTTAIDATFLVNPSWEAFRAVSKRPVFVTWKDGSAMLWDRSFVGDWLERLCALGLDITQPSYLGGSYHEELARLYGDLDDDKVNGMIAHFALDYWVASSDKLSTFPVVFQNQSWKVLDLRHARDSNQG